MEEKLIVGRVYDFTNGLYEGQGVYLGARTEVKYGHVIASKKKKSILKFLFESYHFDENGKLIIESMRGKSQSNIPLKERRYLEERLKLSGIN